MNRQAGQNTMEYVLIVSIIVAVLIAFIGPGGALRGAVDHLFQKSSDWLTKVGDGLPN